jgi:hypothetical protein
LKREGDRRKRQRNADLGRHGSERGDEYDRADPFGDAEIGIRSGRDDVDEGGIHSVHPNSEVIVNASPGL